LPQEKVPPRLPSMDQQLQLPVDCSASGEQLWDKAHITLKSPLFLRKAGQPLIIFDWDDTFMPTTRLKEESLLDDPTPASDVSQTDPSWAACAAAGVRALQKAKQVGRVLIVTNAALGWVEESMARFLPELAAELASVPVISARSIFEPQGVESWNWKVHCFQRIAQSVQVQDMLCGQFQQEIQLVSIGDSLAERVAAQEVARDASLHWKATTVKLKDQPTVDDLTEQLLLCAESLPTVLPCETSLDLHVCSDGKCPTSCRLEHMPPLEFVPAMPPVPDAVHVIA